MSEPGLWGPTLRGGRRLRGWRRALVVAAAGLGVVVLGLAATGLLLIRTAEANLTRFPVAALEQRESGKPINVLVVGSDAREGLTPEEIRRYHLGSFSGQRSDTVILVSVTPDRSAVNVVHFPRDLYVLDHGRPRKLTETFDGGPDALVDVITANFGVPIHHYVEVSVSGFIEVVDAVGSVEICLDEPLVDRKSGADLPAGCSDLDPTAALAYVRSRAGARGDFERIERQQRFLRAMLDELVAARTFVDLPRLFGIVEEVAGTVRTDDALGLNQMRTLAEDLRGLAGGTIPMTVVPGYTRTIDGQSFVLPYRPGALALFRGVLAGEPLPSRGTRAEREAVDVVVWTGDRAAAAAIVESTLNWGGFTASPGGPGEVDAGAETTVYAITGHDDAAGWVAATLGTTARPLPATIDPPEDAEVVVAVGDDAADVG